MVMDSTTWSQAYAAGFSRFSSCSSHGDAARSPGDGGWPHGRHQPVLLNSSRELMQTSSPVRMQPASPGSTPACQAEGACLQSVTPQPQAQILHVPRQLSRCGSSKQAQACVHTYAGREIRPYTQCPTHSHIHTHSYSVPYVHMRTQSPTCTHAPSASHAQAHPEPHMHTRTQCLTCTSAP